ncbi:MAG: aminopeptidase [Candidatus Thermoplasmatota archaeon]
MADPRIERLARLAVRYSVEAKKGQEILISAPPGAAALARALYKEGLDVGAYPTFIGSIDGLEDIFFRYATKDQLTHVSPFRRFLYEQMDALIAVAMSTNTRNMTNVPPEKSRMTAASRKDLVEIFNRRTADGFLKWVGLPFPGNADAQEASMSLMEYEEFVYASCLVDRDDPIKEWKRISRLQAGMISRLKGVSELRFTGEDTDLSMSIESRRWENCDGKKNLPDGEIFTSPAESSVEGRIRFTFPGIYMGREIEDIRLTFRSGKVVRAQALKGEELLKALLKTDEGACRLGEVAIGTNPGIRRFTKHMLFDEKMDGTIHMALGNGYPETGSKNFSVIHWDLLKDMTKGGRIYADGALVYKDGRWTV